MGQRRPGDHEPPQRPGRVVVGVVGKPFGLHGEVYVHPDPDLGHEFAAGARLERDHGAALVVASSRLHAGRRIVAFEGVEDREGAEGLRGTRLRVPRSELTLESDAFWVEDLLGREVSDQHGCLVGVVEGSLDGHAHDYLVIARTDGGELLIPAVEELVTISDDGIVVRAIPGLLDEA